VRKLTLAAVVAVIAALSAGVAAADAATTTVKVTQNDIGSSWFETDMRPPGYYQFVEGPATAPLGRGSLELVTPDGSSKVNLSNFDYQGTLLSAVDDMSYYTYRSSSSTGSAVQAPSLQVAIDPNGDGTGFDTLVFEPVYNTGQGALTDDAWQHWDAFDGGQATWWSTRAIGGTCASTCYRSWSDIVADNPGATVLSVTINQGSGNPGIDANTDAIEFGTADQSTVWDFEPLTGPPASKDECKQGGWQKFDNPSFKNQGDCVSYVATGGRH
jgi:hypothetical protein